MADGSAALACLWRAGPIEGLQCSHGWRPGCGSQDQGSPDEHLVSEGQGQTQALPWHAMPPNGQPGCMHHEQPGRDAPACNRGLGSWQQTGLHSPEPSPSRMNSQTLHVKSKGQSQGLTSSLATYALPLEVAQSSLEGSTGAGASLAAWPLDAAEPPIGVDCHVGEGEEDVALLAGLLHRSQKAVRAELQSGALMDLGKPGCFGLWSMQWQKGWYVRQWFRGKGGQRTLSPGKAWGR